MPSIIEENLTFDFPVGWDASKFDEWSFYRNQFQRVCSGTKAIDILAISPDDCVWMIEVKDYREHRRIKPSSLASEVACKVRDTLAALAAARLNAVDEEERRMAGNALTCREIRIVLHLEQRITQSKVFARAIDPANVLQRLRQIIKSVDPNPQVLERSRLGNVQWTVK